MRKGVRIDIGGIDSGVHFIFQRSDRDTLGICEKF